MAVLYVREQGAMVSKMGERIVVKKNLNTLLDLPVFQVDALAVFGNVQISTQALGMLLEHGCDVSYFTRSGRYLGHTQAESSRNIFLRFGQYNCYMDEQRRLAIARTIIDSKIGNQLALIRQHRWTDSLAQGGTAAHGGTDQSTVSDINCRGNISPGDGVDHERYENREKHENYDWKRDAAKIEELRATLPQQTTPNEILGIEGICSNIYFSAFGHMLRGDFPFKGRNRRPPKDPVNVILSLAYTFLTREMCAALDAASFEAYLGFLHGIRYGRKSLALDMIEEFRQPAVDRLVLFLFGKRILSQFDFDMEEDRVILNEDGFNKFCREYERWMSGANTLAGENFHARVRDQVSVLKHAITENTAYVPYRWKAEKSEK